MNSDILVRVMAGALFLIVLGVLAFRRKKTA
jgi:LPXTG-motif cell wall-anchored protein